MSQRRYLFWELFHSPIFVVFVVSGLREWDLIRVERFPRGCSPPNPLKRLIGDSAELVHAPPYIRVGRENGSADVLLVV